MPRVRIQWSSNAQPMLGEGMPSEWSKNGSLINKPPRGWLHPDSQVIDGGVKYGVRVSDYIFSHCCYLFY